MTWLSEYDVEETVRILMMTGHETSRWMEATRVLQRLINWTNSNSDGWHSWPKPSRAAQRLQAALYDAAYEARQGRLHEDLTEAQLRTLLVPVKAFLTRQGVPHSILDAPPPPPPVVDWQAEVRKDLEVLERIGCHGTYCEGPDKPPEDMITCHGCWRVHELRALLA